MCVFVDYLMIFYSPFFIAKTSLKLLNLVSVTVTSQDIQGSVQVLCQHFSNILDPPHLSTELSAQSAQTNLLM